ncbi:MAG: geranylgeranyl reductase family protein, partial [Candidatus Lindowbacteria bacterium]|nr:geranylgeranyl reductase family protein [Candidatus Lindowbacteria bacterium]
MSTSNHHEVIVVGTGPGGATAARRMAQKGRDVLILEKAELPRHKACGGGLTGNVAQHLDFDASETIENSISSTHFVFRGGQVLELNPAGLKVDMVHRNKFDYLLTQKAVEAGAILKEKTPLKRIRSENGKKIIETPNGEFTADIIIGADGAASTTARAVGLRKNAPFGTAIDADLEPPEEVYEEWKDKAIFDFGIIPHGYGWSFPKGKLFSVGVGTTNRKFKDGRQHLETLMARYPCLQNPVSIVER